LVSISANSRQVEGVTIVDLTGNITLEEGSALLRRTVQNLVRQGNRNVVLNMGAVEEVDHAGLGELVSAQTFLRQAGGALRLLNLSARVRELLEITKLYEVFAVSRSEASAVKALRS
jgi:anti-sigma B factor antagonist